MKKSIYVGLLCLSGFLAISFIQKEPDMYLLQTESSNIKWSNKPEEGKSHNGTIKFKSGNLKFDVKTLVGGYFYINMQGITCDDITDEGFNREFVQEIRAAEVFNIVKYKEATLKITKAKRLDVADGKPNYEINAIYNLKGLKIPVSFPALITFNKKKIGLKASFTLDKKEFQLPYDVDLKVSINTIKK